MYTHTLTVGGGGKQPFLLVFFYELISTFEDKCPPPPGQIAKWEMMEEENKSCIVWVRDDIDTSIDLGRGKSVSK